MVEEKIKLLTLCVAFGALAISITSLVVAFAGVRFNIRNKQLDAIINDHKRFDELQRSRAEILVAQANGSWDSTRLKIETQIFFDRFWSLQFDAYLAWFSGYIPTSIYTYWLFARWRELREPSPEWTLDGVTLENSLLHIEKRWARNPDSNSRQSKHVNNFMHMMRYLRDNQTITIDELLEKYGPGKLLLNFRKLVGAH